MIYQPVPSNMIICGSWFCMENKKKKKNLKHTRIQSSSPFSLVGTKVSSQDIISSQTIQKNILINNQLNYKIFAYSSACLVLLFVILWGFNLLLWSTQDNKRDPKTHKRQTVLTQNHSKKKQRELASVQVALIVPTIVSRAHIFLQVCVLFLCVAW